MNTTRALAIAGAIGVIFLAILYGTSVAQVTGLTQQKNSLQSQVDLLTNQTATLQNVANNLTDQINQLNKDMATLKQPKLTAIALNITGNQTGNATGNIHITGYVINVGKSTAHNCTLAITLNQNQTLTKEYDVNLPDLEPEKAAALNQTITIEGITPTDWKTDLHWTT